MKCPKQPALACSIGNIGVSAHLMVAFSGFYESHEPPPSGDACSIVPPHHDGHPNGQQSGYMMHHRCVDCCPGGRLGDTERGVTRCRRPVASGEALVMLHWEMRSVLNRRTAMAIKMAHDRGAFICRRCLF
jgi:hypothetical protein